MNLREYNELFMKMNIQTSQDGNLISGPKFFNIINEIDPVHEDYNQYIEKRRLRGLSTSRKTFCREILEELNDNIREYVINRINQIANEFRNGDNEHTTQVSINNNFSNSISNKIIQNTQIDRSETPNNEIDLKEVIVESNFVHVVEPNILNLEMRNPKVFISYSWDDEEHKEWVLKLSADLRSKGIETILDRYFLRSGVNASIFMEQSIEQADKVLIIFTEKYKEKASGRSGGVGTEYSMMSIDLCRNIAGNTKYIPVLRKGSSETSIPLFLQPYIASYMTDAAEYPQKINELVHAIFDKSVIAAPKIGEIPDYIRE